MGSYIAKWIGGKLIQDKILKERLENKFGVDVSVYRIKVVPSHYSI